MGLFDWAKEVKDEVKKAIAASAETSREVVRLQERVQRAEKEYSTTSERFETILTAQSKSISELRDRLAKLEAQRDALHNNAMVIAAQYGARDIVGLDPTALKGLLSDEKPDTEE